MPELSLRFIRRAKTLQYDDTCQVLIDGVVTHSFPCNTQPGTQKAGTATLAPGKYRYRCGTHGLSKPPSRRYAAFVQAAPVYVFRAGSKNELHRVDYSINIHKGSTYSVSSLGCLTFSPSVWEKFKPYVYSELDRLDQSTFEVVLENEIYEEPVKPTPIKPFMYFVNGKRYIPFTVQGGKAIVQVRKFIAELLEVEPSSLTFEWKHNPDSLAPESEDSDCLFYNGKEIEVIDCANQEGVTFGTLASCARAAGKKVLIDDAKKEVTIK